MTTTVTVRTHDREAKVQQIYTSGDSQPVTIPAESEMTFYVHTDMDILVFEEPIEALEDESRPVLGDEWFEGASAYVGERAADPAPRVQDGTSYFHGIHGDGGTVL